MQLSPAVQAHGVLEAVHAAVSIPHVQVMVGPRGAWGEREREENTTADCRRNQGSGDGLGRRGTEVATKSVIIDSNAPLRTRTVMKLEKQAGIVITLEEEGRAPK